MKKTTTSSTVSKKRNSVKSSEKYMPKIHDVHLESPIDIFASTEINLNQEIPKDEKLLLNRAITLWQFGNWKDLIEINFQNVNTKITRNKLNLLIASAYQQTGELNKAKELYEQAIQSGTDKNILNNLMLSGVFNTLGKARYILDSSNSKTYKRHFKNSIAIGAPELDSELLGSIRAERQLLDFIKDASANSNDLIHIIELQNKELKELRSKLKIENNEESKQKKNKISNSKDEIHHYWKSPWHENNLPDAYSEAPILRSQLLEELIKKYARPEFKILEFGCNVGRNLNYLFNAGYKNLTGIEISTNAVEQLNKKYPEMASHSKIYNAPIENIIKTFQDNEYDLVFTIAVFEHIHTDSEWIFPDVARITNNILITIEDEQTDSWRHFTRNYRNVFEPLGMEQLETIQCNKVLHSLSSSFFVRIFKKI